MVIVVSRESLNRGDILLVVSVTSQDFSERKGFANCVPFEAGSYACFPEDCVAQAENPILIEKYFVDMSSGPIATLLQEDLRALVQAIGYVIDAECEPGCAL